MSSFITQIKNFLSNEECSQIVSYFNSSSVYTPTDNEFYKNRTLSYQFIQNPELKKLVAKYKVDACCKARELFDKKLYPDYTDIVVWKEGMFMDAHADNAYIDGQPNNFPYREISCVLYLNDDYEGGSTFFPKQEADILPETGKIVFFPSGLDFVHGVKKVTKGTRYTLSMWMTSDFTKIDV